MSTDGPILPGCETLRPMAAEQDAAARGGEQRAPPKAKAHARGRFGVINAFVDFALRRVLRSDAVVWLVLWRDTKPDGLARTSGADMARRTGLHVSTVKRAVRRLRRAGLLVVVRRGSLRSGPSVYRVRGLPCDEAG